MLRRMMRTPTEEYGVNSVTMTYDTNIILSYEVAKEVFLEWYNREEYYTYEVESATTNTMYSGKFIVQAQGVDNNIFRVINKLPYNTWK